MKLTKKKIEETVAMVAGDKAVPVVNYLMGKKNISEFIVAAKVKYDMQTIRNILYKLNSANIASYIRKKDREKGWYISYWTFHRERVKDLIIKIKKEKLDKLKERLQREEQNINNFYICERACARLDFDTATEFEFKCPECGSILQLQDNIKTVENLKKSIKDIEAKLEA